MLQAAQIRAARALLGWKQDDLAKVAKIGIATIRRIEGQEGPMMGYVSTLMRIQSAFEEAGIRFLDNDAEGGIAAKVMAIESGGVIVDGCSRKVQGLISRQVKPAREQN